MRTKEFEGYSKGEDAAYMEFTSPARDKGTRFLKLGEELRAVTGYGELIDITEDVARLRRPDS